MYIIMLFAHDMQLDNSKAIWLSCKNLITDPGIAGAIHSHTN